MLQLNKQFSDIIESGSVDKGHYAKFADGTLICSGRGQTAANTSSVDIYFPVPFAASTFVNVIVTNGWTYSRNIMWSALPQNAYYFRAWPVDVTTGNTPTVQGDFSWVAIGRWKT